MTLHAHHHHPRTARHGAGDESGSPRHEAEVRIRQADGYDVDEIIHLLSAGIAGGSRRKPDREKLAKGVSMMCAGGEERVVLVAEKKGSLVGVVLAQLIVSAAEGGIIAVADSLTVRPLPEARQVEERLLAEVEAWSHSLGAHSAYLVDGRLPGAAARPLRRVGAKP